mmetsp:Transcript_1811/g.5783  ORF Transcript_1811/g.5783 Transcript_1811/m.5783 type:complete len:190 (-) Transcript_1811:185-754(-)
MISLLFCVCLASAAQMPKLPTTFSLKTVQRDVSGKDCEVTEIHWDGPAHRQARVMHIPGEASPARVITRADLGWIALIDGPPWQCINTSINLSPLPPFWPQYIDERSTYNGTRVNKEGHKVQVWKRLEANGHDSTFTLTLDTPPLPIAYVQGVGDVATFFSAVSWDNPPESVYQAPKGCTCPGASLRAI